MIATARDLGHRAREIVRNGGLLLDVRTPEEHRESRIPMSVNIPVQELARRLSELPDRHQAIVVYCRSGGRSASATTVLQNAGFSQVFDLGAMSNW